MLNKTLIGIPYWSGTDWVFDCIHNLVDNTNAEFDLYIICHDYQPGADYQTTNYDGKHKIIRHTVDISSISKNWNRIIDVGKEYKYLAILNDDILFPQKSDGWCWLSHLLEEIEQGYGVVSPTWCWTGYDIEKYNDQWRLESDKNWAVSEPGISGWCFIGVNDIFQKYRFDERFLTQWEE